MKTALVCMPVLAQAAHLAWARNTLDNLERVENRGIAFVPIDFNGFRVSIQASAFHYSRPRVHNLPSCEYEEFEVAFLHDKKFLTPRNDPRFAPLEGMFSPYDDVCPYVPRETVAWALAYLHARYNLAK